MISIANIDSGDQTLTYQEIPVNELVNKLLQEMKEYAQAKVKFYYTPCQTDYILSSNEDIVHQILINLLHNALKSLCRILAERIEARVYLDDTYQNGCLFTFEHPLK